MTSEGRSVLGYRIGAFEIDVRAGELRRSGIKLKLHDQTFRLLCILLERPGEVVLREELQRRLWPEGIFVNFDRGLNSAVTRAREALNDSADQPRFIETLTRRGYRFVAPVEVIEDSRQVAPGYAAVLSHEEELPSAPAGETGTLGTVPAPLLSIKLAVFCLLWIVVGIGAMFFLKARVDFLAQVPAPKSAEVLEERAVEIAQMFGYTNAPADSASGFYYDTSYFRYVQEHDPSPGRWARLQTHQPAVLRFWYRHSAEFLEPKTGGDVANVLGVPLFRRVTLDDPPFEGAGTVRVELDALGRLVSFEGLPPDTLATEPSFDWSVAFTTAGLDPARFRSSPPRQIAGIPQGNESAAWEGSYRDGTPVRVEAASRRGRPVGYRVLGPTKEPAKRQPSSLYLTVLIVLVPLLGASLLTWRNLRMGQGDRRGAFRFAACFFAASMFMWLAMGHHVAGAPEVSNFAAAVAGSLTWSAGLGVIYMAMEPHLKRKWPQALSSWNHILNGRFLDPSVGRDLLTGTALGVAGALVLKAEGWATLATGGPPWAAGTLLFLLGVRATGVALLWFVFNAVGQSLARLFLLFLLRAFIRQPGIATVIWVLLMLLPTLIGTKPPAIILLFGAVFWAIAAFALIRFGSVAFASLIFTGQVLFAFPLTLDSSRFYATSGLLASLLVFSISAYAFHIALAGRRLFRKELL